MNLIPANNPCALIGYYLGIFSLVPCLGVLFGIPAVILGVLGLRAAGKNPDVGGTVHAWVAIVLGAITTLLYGGLILMGVLAAVAEA
jgi:hypothetical protein